MACVPLLENEGAYETSKMWGRTSFLYFSVYRLNWLFRELVDKLVDKLLPPTASMMQQP